MTSVLRDEQDNGLPDACNALLALRSRDRAWVLARFSESERQVIRVLCEGGWIEDIATQMRMRQPEARAAFHSVLSRLVIALKVVAVSSGRRTRHTVCHWLDIPERVS